MYYLLSNWDQSSLIVTQMCDESRSKCASDAPFPYLASVLLWRWRQSEGLIKMERPSVLTSRCSRPFKVSKCHREKDHFPPETLTAGRGQSDSTAALAEVSANQPIRRGGACLDGWSRSVCCHFMIWLLVSNLLSLLEHEAHHYPLVTQRLTNNRWQVYFFLVFETSF